jgi:hypothetical protein
MKMEGTIGNVLAGFEVFMVVTVKSMIWIVVPCSSEPCLLPASAGFPLGLLFNHKDGGN